MNNATVIHIAETVGTLLPMQHRQEQEKSSEKDPSK